MTGNIADVLAAIEQLRAQLYRLANTMPESDKLHISHQLDELINRYHRLTHYEADLLD